MDENKEKELELEKLLEQVAGLIDIGDKVSNSGDNNQKQAENPISVENQDLPQELIITTDSAKKEVNRKNKNIDDIPEELLAEENTDIIDKRSIPEEIPPELLSEDIPALKEEHFPASGKIEVAGDVLYVKEEEVEEVFPDIAEGEISEQIEDTIKKVRQLSPEQLLKQKKKRIRKKAVMGLWHLFSIARVIFILLASVYLSIKAIDYGSEFLGIDRPEKLQLIKIESGMTADDIADKLVAQNVITKKNMFKLTVRLRKAGSSFVTGEHYVSANMGYTDIIEEMTTVIERDTVRITFKEGIYLKEAADLLAKNGVIGKVTGDTSAEDKEEYALHFIEVFNSYMNGYKFEKYLEDPIDTAFYPREGFFFPSTYEFYQYKEEEDIDVVCAKIYDALDASIDDKMLYQMQLKGYSINDLLALSSVVQMEAPSMEEMKKVSSVFQNRLKNPAGIGRTQPYLESDPTKKYVEEVIRPNMDPGAVRNKIMLAYDTYQTAGLPPTAICNPGLEAITAVLYPENTNYYYFAANIDTKETLYAYNLAGQNANLEIIQQQYEDALNTEIS
ncbi:MAG: endolytic transglycosylase MltG [Oscillospiraceae bacterium]|jgi:UPF0755 protein|nr:endolytic transglycosylase MltG [Oscillospiraceae bacterium]